MINQESFTKEWIESFRKKRSNKRIDPAIVEKMIWAFYLLEQLSERKLNFMFKGGTSLILLLENANRFSIDIDITTEENRDALETVLNSIIENSNFIEYKLDRKRSYREGVPKAHYKFYYNSIQDATQKIKANYVLLDVVFEKAVYPEINKIEIKTDWLKTITPYYTVKLPSINAILGDKLTAFAPNTTGIRYQKGKEIEICKQLFDISELIDQALDYEIVYSSFLETVKKEIDYRSLDINAETVLDDLFDTALIIARREKNRGDDASKYREIQTGLRNFSNFTITKNFRIEEAISASAKAACIAMKLKNGDFTPIELYQSNLDLTNLEIENKEYQFLNKLRKSNKPAFYYWYQCLLQVGELS